MPHLVRFRLHAVLEAVVGPCRPLPPSGRPLLLLAAFFGIVGCSADGSPLEPTADEPESAVVRWRTPEPHPSAFPGLPYHPTVLAFEDGVFVAAATSWADTSAW